MGRVRAQKRHFCCHTHLDTSVSLYLQQHKKDNFESIKRELKGLRVFFSLFEGVHLGDKVVENILVRFVKPGRAGPAASSFARKRGGLWNMLFKEMLTMESR